MKNIVIFASGSGTNAEKIMEFYQHSENAKVTLVVCDKPKAGVLDRAEKYGVPTHLINKSDIDAPYELVSVLLGHKTDLIVLAGFLKKIPEEIIVKYPNRIINIHPALLPKYGGRGMYGDRVHESVIANQESESGITIHYVNEAYDEGAIIFQAKCEVSERDTATSLAEKIHKLEHDNFPKIIDKVLSL
ncbi:MAG: phosphoribosylglycinamide formyltransferase [Salibacteraceae bacterium]